VIDDGHFLDTRFRAIADAVWIHELLGSGYKAGVLNKPLSVFTQTGKNLGQSEAGRNEAREWRHGSKLAAAWWSGLHRLRKTRAGCYRRRKVGIALHTDGGPSRTEWEGVVGEVWKTIKES